MDHRTPRPIGTAGLCPAPICMILAVLLIIAAAPAAGQPLVKVDVRSNSGVDREMIMLGDIAVIDGDDPQLVGRLKSLAVGRSPLPGSSRNLSAGELTVRMKQAGIDTARIQLNAPAVASVTRNSVTIEGPQIQKIVRDFIRQNLPDRRIEMSIREIRVPEKVVLPGGRVRYEVASGPQGEMLGTFAVAVTFRVNESFEKKVWARVTVDALVEAVVTVRAMGRYRPITADDITVRKIDLSELPVNAITDPDDVLGKRTKRAIHSNRVLSTDLVELPPLVKRGDLVTIVAQLEGLKITTLGKVKKKGRQGERIPVLNMDSQKVIFARVVDANTVAVEF